MPLDAFRQTNLRNWNEMLFVRDFHPMQWTLDDTRDDDTLIVEYPYTVCSSPF